MHTTVECNGVYDEYKYEYQDNYKARALGSEKPI